MHPAIENVLRFFKCDHLPDDLRRVVRPFTALAQEVAERAPDNQETTVALRKLLEAKDAAVRAALQPEQSASVNVDVALAEMSQVMTHAEVYQRYGAPPGG